MFESRANKNLKVRSIFFMQFKQSTGIISRRWPVALKHYWFGQRPEKESMPDIARLHSIPGPLTGAINTESWTMLTDLSGTDEDVLALLHRDTRKQARRAEREGISIERYDCSRLDILDDFQSFYNKFSDSKSEVSDVLKISVQLHMLKRMADAGILEVSRTIGDDGVPIVYHVIIIADGRARVHHSASHFRKDQSSERRHYLGRANRYFHLKNMLHYKHQGYSQYDMGGWYSGKDNTSLLRVNQFKEEFGGRVVCEFDALYGCTAAGKCALLVHGLYQSILQSKLN